MSVIGIIPARYASTRFPGKPLALINGKSMLQRVFEQAKKANLLDHVLVATDDARIMAHCKEIGAEAVMTGIGHPSGTDRCFEAYTVYDKAYDYVLNIQGDEPFLDPVQIDSICRVCDGNTEIATQMTRCTSHEVLFDQGEAKIVLNDKKEALYFSRSVVPFVKGIPEKEWHNYYTYYRHVGMYAYRVDVLEQICKLSLSSLERAESLEQLRWLENGFRIKCVETDFDSHGIDTPEDIPKVLSMMNFPSGL